MKSHEKGVLPGSELYFYSAGPAAKRIFYYPVCTGHFVCDASYSVMRRNYDSFLVLYVVSGRGYAEQGSVHCALHAGMFAMLDCYAPHSYGTQDGWEIDWLHFDGRLARDFFSACTQNGFVFSPRDPSAAHRALRLIYEDFCGKSQLNDALFSCRITELLTELYRCANESAAAAGERGSASVESVLAFLSQNADRPVSVAEMAGRMALSPFHFTRVFRAETGITPHAYLVNIRISHAEFLLKTTARSVKEIGFECGFNSECSFCTSFKRITGITPSAYRSESAAQSGGKE